ncbi:hypothetical protein AB4144_47145, partial [Rhizobiaceae sp. 2RAB30]
MSHPLPVPAPRWLATKCQGAGVLVVFPFDISLSDALNEDFHDPDLKTNTKCLWKKCILVMACEESSDECAPLCG